VAFLGAHVIVVRRSFIFIAATLAALTACRGEFIGPSSARLAGTYVLTSVSGRGPATGIVTLSVAGAAERRVRYQLSGAGLSPEYVARGTYRARADGTIDLRLREDDGQSPYVWQPLAEFSGNLVRIRHPDPADGPEIIETYQRR
jgi:hypothetical protein